MFPMCNNAKLNPRKHKQKNPRQSDHCRGLRGNWKRPFFYFCALFWAEALGAGIALGAAAALSRVMATGSQYTGLFSK